MHFSEDEAELFPLSENMFMPGKSSVEVEPEIFDVFRLGDSRINGCGAVGGVRGPKFSENTHYSATLCPSVSDWGGTRVSAVGDAWGYGKALKWLETVRLLEEGAVHVGVLSHPLPRSPLFTEACPESTN
jgi:hypothetical protein